MNKHAAIAALQSISHLSRYIDGELSKLDSMSGIPDVAAQNIRKALLANKDLNRLIESAQIHARKTR